MLQDITPHTYYNEMRFCVQKPSDFVLQFENRTMTANLADGVLSFPQVSDFEDGAALQYLFTMDDRAYFLHRSGALRNAASWQHIEEGKLRSLDGNAMLFAAAVGGSLARWYRANRFCGACGAAMQPSKLERALVCPQCGNTVYPKICPAVIVTVTDGERLLLTRYKDRPFKKYALVAGFAEIGETIEQTVHREVLEETGLRVKNLRFYKSQPWVFTDTLLMGFYCELDGSDRITVQEDELAEAAWFSRAELPEDHSHISLTGEMIETFRRGEC